MREVRAGNAKKINTEKNIDRSAGCVAPSTLEGRRYGRRLGRRWRTLRDGVCAAWVRAWWRQRGVVGVVCADALGRLIRRP